MTYIPQHFNVWCEIPTTDLPRAVEYYSAVTGADLKITEDAGPNPMAFFPTTDNMTGVGGHIYPGTPAPRGTGPTIHLTAKGTLEEVMERVTKAGGEVLSPPIDIPAGRFAYTHDLDGNSISFFQAH